ncbi:hypothetical protein [Nocardioides flavescens]|uniref:Uncharacterized protein n=1 Tax=Nocardioides flavescens TaxID=2691959 RepID=A0A6L7F4E4_9ACTN|nr:hypothetical protein [Nocardioides flavescens]MXG92064.1 hypothetical protein [Nocardioides flavescens]
MSFNNEEPCLSRLFILALRLAAARVVDRDPESNYDSRTRSNCAGPLRY